jgi:hypothetical protein
VEGVREHNDGRVAGGAADLAGRQHAGTVMRPTGRAAKRERPAGAGLPRDA